MGKLSIASRTDGDVKVSWDPKDELGTKAAKEMFDVLIEKGYLAYDVSSKEDRKALKKFDAEAGEVFMAPPLVGG